MAEGEKSTYPLLPATIYDDYPDFVETDIVPIDIEGMTPASVSHRLDVNFATYDDGINHASCECSLEVSSRWNVLRELLTMGLL